MMMATPRDPNLIFNPSGDLGSRQGREEEIQALWEQFYLSFYLASGRVALTYFHASPGIGKTFLLREIMKKIPTDIPQVYHEFAETVSFVGISFDGHTPTNKGIEKDWASFKSVFFRIFYQEFVGDISWESFLNRLSALNRHEVNDVFDTFYTMFKERYERKKLVFLVDEVMKARYPLDAIRQFCSLQDTDPNKRVLFATSEQDLLISEITYSRRSVRALIELSLLTFDQSYALLNDAITGELEACVRDKHTLCQMLALISRGHPRTVEFLVEALNVGHRAHKDSSTAIDIAAIIKIATSFAPKPKVAIKLTEEMIKLALLRSSIPAERVFSTKKGDFTARTLVSLGIFMASLTRYESPMKVDIPELFFLDSIHKAKNSTLKKLLVKLYSPLYTPWEPKKWGKFHVDWEILIRHCREGEAYSSIPIRDIYPGCLVNPKADKMSASHLTLAVDAKSNLTLKTLYPDVESDLGVNEIYLPEQKWNPGFDSLLVYKVFPTGKHYSNIYRSHSCGGISVFQVTGENGKGFKKFLLFVHSTISSTTSKSPPKSLKKKDLYQSVNDIESFLRKSSNFDESDCAWGVLFAVAGNTTKNILEGASGNVLLARNEHLEKLYGENLMRIARLMMLNPSQNVFKVRHISTGLKG